MGSTSDTNLGFQPLQEASRRNVSSTLILVQYSHSLHGQLDTATVCSWVHIYFSVFLGRLPAVVLTHPPSTFNMWHHPSILSGLQKLECIDLEYGSAQWELELISWQCYCWYMLCPESCRENQIRPFGSFSARLLSLHQMENVVCWPDCSSTCSSRSRTFGVSLKVSGVTRVSTRSDMHWAI